jgi:hypothetical protein
VNRNAFDVLLIIAFVAAVLAFSRSARATDDWLVVVVGSRHRQQGYNEHNWGLGIEHGVNDRWRVIGGTYRNSFYRQTLYAGAVYMPLRSGDWRIGGTAMLATGYDRRFPVFVFPVVSYEQKEWGINFGPILPMVVGVQLKFRY